ncbi:hypothetical protein D8674_023861 [Pyrus ussuriensis x Pyrus communis]|uniref:Uncharacterized protein n=1 Tax=Pyrus ussuriensis x Pyrus communis TaxID=2448454 RepID=A0A5N5H1C8_9ROSA|nr:hypothetical protein D8674_023861 [Pyrus ussuriensis x Pyrus communis]
MHRTHRPSINVVVELLKQGDGWLSIDLLGDIARATSVVVVVVRIILPPAEKHIGDLREVDDRTRTSLQGCTRGETLQDFQG